MKSHPTVPWLAAAAWHAGTHAPAAQPWSLGHVMTTLPLPSSTLCRSELHATPTPVPLPFPPSPLPSSSPGPLRAAGPQATTRTATHANAKLRPGFTLRPYARRADRGPKTRLERELRDAV